MFEDFSFSSPRGEGRSTLTPKYNEDMVAACDSGGISPLSSRCPSPVPFRRNSKDHPLFPRHWRQPFKLGPAPAPTSIPYNYSDGPRLSIGTLTKKLHAQSLDNDASSDSDEASPLPITPPCSTHSGMPPIWLENEPLSPSYREHDDNFAWAGPSPTSTPSFIDSRRSSLSGGNISIYSTQYAPITTQDPEQFSSLRQHRENLALLQCTAKTVAETVKIALLLEGNDRLCFNEIDEERHPSSLTHLPLSRKRSSFSNNHNQKSSRRSLTEPTLKSKLSMSHISKVEKPRHFPQSFSQSSGFRKAAKSPQGLRRRSLVLAAVTAMAEAEDVRQDKRDCGVGDIQKENPRNWGSDT
ncbi:hypothetical protein AJ78_07391 [Emergomyces pasteurianus Ep9510]|uniref:Uncharacterized protein n=1 Tax=Emergomyces pasteurianus Ep9510 TaxID=1447872 RepID=A0A1J9P757_9EURO|nr:hypothetical protein AJ78_07391 [Emergomyces pasteurianus Ep9510]